MKTTFKKILKIENKFVDILISFQYIVFMSLRIVFTDGTWLERWEEDGFEAWLRVTPPKKDVNKFRHGFINLRSPWQVKINESY